MELIYLRTTSNTLSLPWPCMHINHSSINALAYTSDAELVLVTFPNETTERRFVECEWLGKLISSEESH